MPKPKKGKKESLLKSFPTWQPDTPDTVALWSIRLMTRQRNESPRKSDGWLPYTECEIGTVRMGYVEQDSASAPTGPHAQVLAFQFGVGASKALRRTLKVSGATGDGVSIFRLVPLSKYPVDSGTAGTPDIQESTPKKQSPKIAVKGKPPKKR